MDIVRSHFMALSLAMAVDTELMLSEEVLYLLSDFCLFNTVLRRTCTLLFTAEAGGFLLIFLCLGGI